MVAITIIVGYVISVFLNRWINKIAYKREKAEIEVWLWFIPILTSIVMLIIILENIEKKNNWFTGKNW
jgi:cytochrome c-type biogenesis protein CcmH/NrfF